MSNSIYNTPPPSKGLGGTIQQQVAKSASISAGTAYTVVTPAGYTRLSCYFNIHSFPASASTTANIAFYAIDPINGATVSLNAPGVARSATGTTLYFLGQINTSGNSATNCILPRTMTIQLSLSTGATSKEVVFSLGLEWSP